jgi:hypothetical protein
MRQKTRSCFIRDSDSSPHTEVARVCVLSHLLQLMTWRHVDNVHWCCSLSTDVYQLRQDKHQDMRQKTQSCFIHDSHSSPHTEVARVCVLSYLLQLMTWRHVDNVHWCCSLSTDAWVLTHRKGTCRRQDHNSDRCAVVFIISFVSTVLLSLRHVTDIVSMSCRMPVCSLPKRTASKAAMLGELVVCPSDCGWTTQDMQDGYNYIK